MKRVRLVFKDAKSHKFWEIAVRGASHTVRYGRVGSEGRETTKEHASPAAAKASAEKLVASKRKKGYADDKAGAKKTTKKSTGVATNVPSLVRSITKWLTDNDPDEESLTDDSAFFPGEYKEWTRKKPASATAIAAAEKALGVVLPRDYKAYLRVHNGTGDLANVVWGQLHRVQDIATKTQWLRDMADDDERPPANVDARVKPHAFSDRWVVISTSARNRDHLCLDLDPDSGGTVGQVILVSVDYDGISWLAGSFAEFLDFYLHGFLQGKRREPAKKKRPKGSKRKKRGAAATKPSKASTPSPASLDPADFTAFPRDEKREKRLATFAPKGVAAWGTWLTKQGHPLGEVVAADLAAEAEPPRKKVAKKHAREIFRRYVDGYYRPRFPELAPAMKHFTEDGSDYFGFRYGLLDRVHNFEMQSAAEVKRLEKLFADPHAHFVRKLTLRKFTIKNLKFVARFLALRQLKLDWSDISKLRSIEPLAGMRHLVALHLGGSAVAKLEPLRDVPVVQLYLAKTKVADLTPLSGHPTLQDLYLSYTRVSDLSPLASCKKLCAVRVYEARASEDDADALEKTIKKNRAKPSRDPFLIYGFDKDGVFHG